MSTFFDKFAILLSSICAIHCIALPIIASAIPLFAVTIHHGHQLHEFWFHQFILFFILPVSIIALVMGFRIHRKITPMIVGLLGLAILTGTALFIEQLLYAHIIPHEGETVLTITGGIIHATGHILNLLATRKDQPLCTKTES